MMAGGWNMAQPGGGRRYTCLSALRWPLPKPARHYSNPFSNIHRIAFGVGPDAIIVSGQTRIARTEGRLKNYGEELAYWYFRLNGFFPLTNFVIHRTARTEYPSDSDILAIRPPFVYEEIGGRPDDWDPFLVEALDLGHMLGVVVEVKTGAYEVDDILRPRYLRYAVERLGLTRDVNSVMRQFEGQAVAQTEDGSHIAKILIANTVPRGGAPLLYLSFHMVRAFLEGRMQKYPREKFGDRLFFNSNYLQDLIERVTRDLRARP
jgi:hypothetical protein